MKFSVIVPVYNAEKYLEKCLDSLILQTYENLEIICVNDGSSDNSLSILKKYEAQDKRITIINQENKGAGAARNNGLKAASGEYVSFIDADDWVSLALYKKAKNAIEKSKPDIYMFNGIFEKEKYENNLELFFNIKKWFGYKEKNIFNFNECKSPFEGNSSVCNKIYNINFLKNNNISFLENVIFEDQVFYLESSIKAKTILINNDILYHYKQNVEQSVTNTLDNKAFDIFKIMAAIEKILADTNNIEEYKYAFLQHKYSEYTSVFYKIKDTKQEEFFKIMKKEMSEIKKDDYNEAILKRLINNHLLYDIINLDLTAFYEKNKKYFR